MDDELYLDPFKRSHAGRNGAFICRVNHAHVEEAIKRIRQRRLGEVEISFGVAKPALVKRKAA